MQGTICIPTNFWLDWKFNSMSFTAKSLFIYLLSHAETNSLGCLQKSCEDMCAKTGLSLEHITQCITQCVSHKLLLKGKDNWWFMPNYLEWKKLEYYVCWQNIKTNLEVTSKNVGFFDELLSTIISHVQDVSDDDMQFLYKLRQEFSNKQSSIYIANT